MFSNGDCSEWMVMENFQFTNETGMTGAFRTVIASHYDINYQAKIHSRSSLAEDPWISWLYYGSDPWPYLLYGENSNTATLARVLNRHFNVWLS